MSKSLNINAPQIVQTRNTLNAVPSGSTATPDENVKYVPQTLTDAQKAQARQNIVLQILKMYFHIYLLIQDLLYIFQLFL